MGDLPPSSVPQSLDAAAAGLAHDEHQSSSFRSPASNSPFHSQLSSIPPQARSDIRASPNAGSSSYGTPDYGAFSNMASIVGALPDPATEVGQGQAQSIQQGQRPLSGASTSALVYQLQHNLQLPAHASAGLGAQGHYAGPVQGQYTQNFGPATANHPNYAPYHPSQQRLAGANVMQAPYPAFPQPSQYVYYAPPYGLQAQYSQGFPPQAAHPQAMYGRRPSLPNAPNAMMAQGAEMQQHDSIYSPGHRYLQGSMTGEPGTAGPILSGTFGAAGINRPGPTSSIPRGPPRKPKQSGHALWVGNLPPGTTVVALKDHFSRDATKDIESLFLISKSNCAFVNYRTEASCSAAMHRFHDSRFNGVRLVCRLRRSSAPVSGVPTGPSAMVGSHPATTSPPKSPQVPEVDGVPAQESTSPARGPAQEDRQNSTASEKYFIVKSLTLQDLELSVRNGIWATQSHNEHVLNQAYESAQKVYLIFSANKSGEYFGYARMTSPILEDAKHLLPPAPKPEHTDTTDVPKSIPTPATEFAPRGKIIDDSARGTIFWEAELSDSEVEEPDNDHEQGEQQQPGADASGVAQSWGKPFKIEWISTNRLPFYRTRGLRNPWNANREVKIARDGTELETSVGERLVQMFHRLGPGSVPMSGPIMQAPLSGHQQMPF